MRISRRTAWLAAGACLVSARTASASMSSVMRELRRMTGFSVLAADNVRQSWRSTETHARYIQLREYGLFKEVGMSALLNPVAFTDAIVFVKPVEAHLRRQYPGLPNRAYYEYRLLIDGEFYHVVAFD